jgi:Na+-driven multidrug efflux pump
VRETFYSAALLSTGVMVVLTIICQLAADPLVRIFNQDAAVVAFGSEYLHIVSWSFLASGLVYVSSSVFQGMGNTIPSLGSSALRLFLFAIPGYMLAQRPGFEMRTLWWLSVMSVLVQVTVSVTLLHREFNRRLSFAEIAAEGAVPLPEV